MQTIDAIAEILKREGVQYLSCFPTTPVIEACAAAGIRPIICRQERVGVGIADGYSRVTNGRPPGVFAMQYGPGAENAYSGVATAFSDSVPILLLPLGHPRERQGVFPMFDSVESFASVTKHLERLNLAQSTSAAMRRAVNALYTGRPGPAMVEIPADVALEEVSEEAFYWGGQVRRAAAQADDADVEAAARALCAAAHPVIHAGQGVLYAEATAELVELAELLSVPVMTTLLGKSGFPEQHPLALGSGSGVMNGAVYHFVRRADVILGVGASFTRHGMSMNLPPGRTLIQNTNDPRDLNKDYEVQYPLIGDAKLTLRQLIDACREIVGDGRRNTDYASNAVAGEITAVRSAWLAEWQHKTADAGPLVNPYRVITEFQQAVPADEAIITHDSGSPRDQITPFYRAGGPRSYLGWGKSHGLGTGLGLVIGAKLAAPDQMCVNFMGDAAFGMVGLDFETAVRSGAPITTVVLNNSTMAVETGAMQRSHDLYGTRDLGGNYADLGRAMGGYAERITDPGDIVPAFRRARRQNAEGNAVLLEFITNAEIDYSHKRAF